MDRFIERFGELDEYNRNESITFFKHFIKRNESNFGIGRDMARYLNIHVREYSETGATHIIEGSKLVSIKLKDDEFNIDSVEMNFKNRDEIATTLIKLCDYDFTKVGDMALSMIPKIEVTLVPEMEVRSGYSPWEVYRYESNNF